MKAYGMKFLIAAVAVAALAACGPNETVSSNALEDARNVSKANAEFNAQLYRAANPRFTSDYAIVARSDDMQSAKCPQGDGWAELSIMRAQNGVVDKTVLNCSTYSVNVGCYRKEDFDKNPNLASQHNRCSAEVPYPLPVLKK